MNVQWFPGHMAKTRRLIEENLKLIDIVVELLDARLPISSQNPEIDMLVKNKPRLILLNKADIADKEVTKQWIEYFKEKGICAISISSTQSKNLNVIFDKCRDILKDKLEKQKEKGIVNKPIKIMVVGVPNVGKSSFINKLSGKKSAITGDRPGVTRGKQWIRLKNGFELLDTPGILWPKFEDELTGLKLAFTGAIKDEIMDVELLSVKLLEHLKKTYPLSLTNRYKMTDFDDLDGYEMLTLLGKKRGFVVSGGEIDTLRAANILLDEFRGAYLGEISLETPNDFKAVE
ncbi:MAG: ribosome biogenesis GTPase YlqF [Ruminococcaceae bacterium]|nr:ribosome biogenesis GTPase YlqF [Oscillospiraceae bacterium]